MKISELKINDKLQHGVKGEMTVVDVTKRTVTFVHKFGTTKITYRNNDANVYPSDF